MCVKIVSKCNKCGEVYVNYHEKDICNVCNSADMDYVKKYD